MLDIQNEMKNLVEKIEYERYSLCMAYADCRSEEVSQMLYEVCAVSLQQAIRDLYRARFNVSERAALEEMIGSEIEIVELIIDEAEVCVNEKEFDEIIATIERLAVLASFRHVTVKKLL